MEEERIWGGKGREEIYDYILTKFLKKFKRRHIRRKRQVLCIGKSELRFPQSISASSTPVSTCLQLIKWYSYVFAFARSLTLKIIS